MSLWLPSFKFEFEERFWSVCQLAQWCLNFELEVWWLGLWTRFFHFDWFWRGFQVSTWIFAVNFLSFDSMIPLNFWSLKNWKTSSHVGQNQNLRGEVSRASLLRTTSACNTTVYNILVARSRIHLRIYTYKDQLLNIRTLAPILLAPLKRLHKLSVAPVDTWTRQNIDHLLFRLIVLVASLSFVQRSSVITDACRVQVYCLS